jgi:tetrathionate reductase subunit B
MKHFTLNIEDEKCWGCKTCEAACKQENKAVGGCRLIYVCEEGPKQIEGKWSFSFTVNRCRHCDDPPCAEACPSGAIVRRQDGIVILNKSECSGCASCIPACPYGSISFDEKENIAAKCNLCHHRVDKGLLPACADNVCLAHCIHLGR